jgi:hypothetical protein
VRGPRALLVLLMAPFVVAAQGVSGGAADSALRSAGLRVERAALAGPRADDPVRSSPMHATFDVPRAEVAMLGSSVVLELGRMTPDGRFIRPRLTVGNQSSTLKSWMSELGVPAERCLFPAFRGRLKRDADSGNVGASILMSARCSFY